MTTDLPQLPTISATLVVARARAERGNPLSRSAGEGQGEGDRSGQKGGAPQTTTTHH